MKHLFLSLLLVLPLLAQAQTPQWTNAAFRELTYPASEWYTGFARNYLQSGAEVGAALRTLERDAQNQLAESIIVAIASESLLENISSQQQTDGQFSEVIITHYQQAVRTATSATAVGMNVRSHHNPATGAIYALAVVRRADLAAFYRNQINVDLNRVDNSILASEQLVAAGRRIAAQHIVEEARTILSGVAYHQNLLVAVDAQNTTAEHLQTARYGNLQRTIQQLLIDLEQSTYVYIAYSHERRGAPHDAFTHHYPQILLGIIRQALSENGCAIVYCPEEADYILTIVTSTSQRTDGTGQFGVISYFANVRGTLYNTAMSRQTVSFSLFNDAVAYSTGRNAEEAASRAFRRPAFIERVMGYILPRIGS